MIRPDSRTSGCRRTGQATALAHRKREEAADMIEYKLELADVNAGTSQLYVQYDMTVARCLTK